jgi:flagellar hook-associated protein 2
MAGSAVDGLVTGMSTSTVIAQLMKVEGAPQQALKDKVSKQEKITQAYQTVNSKLVSLKSLAESLTKDDLWKSTRATSSSDAVVASSTAGAATGSLSFNVTQLARAQVSVVAIPASGQVTAGNGIDITVAGQAKHVDVTTDTPQGVADAINAANIGLRAAVITTDGGTKLQLSSTKTGQTNAFAVTSGLPNAQVDVATALDAKITAGDPNSPAYTVSSSTNTFSSLMNGVTLTATKLQNGVTVSVGADVNAVADKVKGMVDATNAALSEIASQTAYNATLKKGGTLAGDYTVRQITGNLLSAVSTGQKDYGSFKQVGISLDRAGQLTFDRAAFVKAYEADPEKVKAALGGPVVNNDKTTAGVATTLMNVAEAATNSTKGSITMAIQGGDTLTRTLNKQIAEWDVRLTSRQQALQRQFSSLEVGLGKMRDKSNWLAGQLAGLANSGG